MDDAFENGWQGLSAFRWGAADVSGARLATPAAGWNICSKSKKEFGFFETVCVFDGDIFIEGLPYRSAELDINSGKFGDSKARRGGRARSLGRGGGVAAARARAAFARARAPRGRARRGSTARPRFGRARSRGRAPKARAR